MRFACSRRIHQDGVFLFLDKMKIKEAEDLGLIGRLWEREIEGLQGFHDREAGLSDTVFTRRSSRAATS